MAETVRTLAQTKYFTWHVPGLEGRTFKTRQEAHEWRQEATPDEEVEIENFVTLELMEGLSTYQSCYISGQQAEAILWKHDSLHPDKRFPHLLLSKEGMVALRDMLNDAIMAYHTPAEKE